MHLWGHPWHLGCVGQCPAWDSGWFVVPWLLRCAGPFSLGALTMSVGLGRADWLSVGALDTGADFHACLSHSTLVLSFMVFATCHYQMCSRCGRLSVRYNLRPAGSEGRGFILHFIKRFSPLKLKLGLCVLDVCISGKCSGKL